MERKPIGKKDRFEVFKRDSFTCQYCGRSAPEVILHVDHIQPVSKDGDNDITNYITSCQDCNLGKGNRELADDTVIQKRKKQLDDLQERREQLDMMVDWQRGLVDIREQETEAAVEFINDLLIGRQLNELGAATVKKMINRIGLSEVLECSKISACQYLVYDETEKAHTPKSVSKMLEYIERIAKSRKKIAEKPYLKDLYYVRGIVRNRMYCKDWKAMELIERAYLSGVSIEDLKNIALTQDNWTDWCDFMEGYIAGGNWRPSNG